MLRLPKSAAVARRCIASLPKWGAQTLFQWEFQDPKMEVLYHIRPYFVGIFPYIGHWLLFFFWNKNWSWRPSVQSYLGKKKNSVFSKSTNTEEHGRTYWARVQIIGGWKKAHHLGESTTKKWVGLKELVLIRSKRYSKSILGQIECLGKQNYMWPIGVWHILG